MAASKNTADDKMQSGNEDTIVEEEKPGSTQSAPDMSLSVSPVKFPIIGIGSSAGGLPALEYFFSALPKDTPTGMAFVVLQHMAPDYRSMLSEILMRYTKMEVHETKDGMTVNPDCVYVLPPNKDMIITEGVLHLVEPAEPRGHRMPIDSFLRTLAQDQHEYAIAIILSGTGSDGTQGVRDIKAHGGMVMVQIPEFSEYKGMPESAIETGMADYILKPETMPINLYNYVSNVFGQKAHPSLNMEEAMSSILNELRKQTGHDFSPYKQSTIERRIRRRMVINHIKRMDGYARYLQQKPDEVNALFHDILINVTSYFRNPDVFEALQQQVIPGIFEGKSPGGLIRVWVIGCSTGEEAYSIAILLQEHMEKVRQNYKVQIFATDIDDHAIMQARKAVFPSGISADVTEERLRRFFVYNPDLNVYTVHKHIRDMIIFSEQDVIKDPPFSKIDLISCRNFLIYLDKEMQKKLMPMFHYSLNAGGYILLGTSESIGDFSDLFDTLDRQAKIYKSKPVRSEYHYSVSPFHRPHEDYLANKLPEKDYIQSRLRLRELTEKKLLQSYAPAGVLVNEQGDILYLYGRTGLYLEMAPGEPDYNILKMARDGLRHALTAILSMAVVNHEQVTRPGIRVKTNGDFTTIDLIVRPLEEAADQKLFLITFESPSEYSQIRDSGKVIMPQEEILEGQEKERETVAALKEELRTMEEYLKASNEELQVSNEELTSSNEEMQSMNEELQSTNEELETSREELQSVNEELSTVNSELETKVSELSEANEDMNNLLASTGVGIVFVDSQLRLQRFTPAATKIMNIIPTDVGRPIEHIVTNLTNYDSLILDTKAVLEDLVPMESEVRTREGEWYTLRIRPYRTIRNTIEGVVITFLKQTEALRRLALVVHDSGDAITLLDLDGNIRAWNPMATKMYGWSEAEALSMNINRIVPENLKQESLDMLKTLIRAEILRPHRTKRLTKDGRIIDVCLTATPLLDIDGGVYSIMTTERKIKSDQ